MDERTSQIVSHLSEQRQRLGDNVVELQRKVREATNWRACFRRRPWLALGLALGGSVLLSVLFLPRSR